MASRKLDAYQTLNIPRSGTPEIICMGLTESGEPCEVPGPGLWFLRIYAVLDDMESRPPEATWGPLYSLARLCLCEEYHRDQVNTKIAEWQLAIQGATIEYWNTENVNTIETLEDKIQKLEVVYGIERTKRKELETELETARKEVEAARTSEKELSDCNTALTEQVSHLQVTVNQLEGDIDWKDYLLKDYTESRDASKIVIKALNPVVETGKRLTDALKAHLSLSKRDRIAALEGQEKLDTQLATILVGINALKGKVDHAEIGSNKCHAEAENLRVNLEVEGLRREVATARENLAATKDELEIIRNQIVLSEATLLQLKKKVEPTAIVRMKDGRMNISISGLLKRGLWFWKHAWTILVRGGLSKLRFPGVAALFWFHRFAKAGKRGCASSPDETSSLFSE